MAATTKKRLKHSDYAVAIICPLEVEMSAVRYMLDDEHMKLKTQEEDPNRYIFGEMSGHNVVIAFLPYGSQGVGAAATVATDMRRTFPAIKLRLLVGIGGGVPSSANDIRLGDVVVGMPEGIHGGVVQYDLGKDTVTGFKRKGYLEPPPKSWRGAVVEMQGDHRVKMNRISDFISKMTEKYSELEAYRPPGPGKDILFTPDNPHVLEETNCEKCDKARVVTRTARRRDGPAIFYGLIASGDRVMKNAETRDKISHEEGGVLCFEMEAAGLVNDFHCVVIRGIADYADSHKNDDWHPYAAAVAAGCAKELLTYMVPVVESQPAKYSTVPHQRVKDFVGREAQLDQITAFFSSRDVNRPRVLILHALGGQGKSQIALEYCRRMDTVYWGLFLGQREFGVDGDTVICHHFPEARRIGGNVVERYGEDNCNDPDVLRDDPDAFPPISAFLHAGGDILVTSRHGGFERLGKVIDIPPLPPDKGADLLLRGFQDIKVDAYRSEASRIVERLGGLALAIDQAAAYIEDSQIPIDRLSKFLDTYEERRQKVLQHTPVDFWEYGAMQAKGTTKKEAVSAFTTWEMSFQQLCQGEDERSGKVAHFLTLSAFFAPTAVGEWLYHHHWEMSDPPPEWISIFTAIDDSDSDEEGVQRDTEVESDGEGHSSARPQPADGGITQAVERLRLKSIWSHDHFWRLISRANKLSLVQTVSRADVPEGVTFLLHPLIRDWLQLREKNRQRRAFTRESVDVIVNSIRVFEQRGTVSGIKQSLLLHMDASLRNDAEFSKSGHQLGEEVRSCDSARRFASFYHDQGRYDLSFELAAAARKTTMDKLGKEHPDTLASMNNLALVLRDQGKYEEAEQMHRGVLGIAQKVLGKEHPDTLTSMNNLALVLRGQGKYEEAEQMHRGVLGIRQKVLGMEHPDTLSSMNNLAGVLRDQGKYEEAEQMHREGLGIRQKVLGMEHPDTLSSMNNLALVLRGQGKYEEAEQMHRGVLGIRQKVLGMEHPDTLSSMNNLALVLRGQGKYEEAEQMHRGVLGIRQKVLGKEHPDTLTSMNNLAAVLGDQGKYEEAEQMHRGVLGIAQKVLGKEHPDTLTSMNNLALVLRGQGKYEEAEQMHRGVLGIAQKVLGMEHPDTLSSMNNLAGVLRDQGKYEEAEQMHREGLGIRQKVLGMEHPLTLTSMNNLALVLRDQGKYEEAEQMHREGLGIRQKVLGMEHPSTLTSMNNLAAVLGDQGKYEEAEQMHREGLGITQRVLGMEHPDTLASMNNLAAVLRDQGKYEEAEHFQAAATAMSLRTLGLHHPNTQTLMENLWSIWQASGLQGTEIMEALGVTIDS